MRGDEKQPPMGDSAGRGARPIARRRRSGHLTGKAPEQLLGYDTRALQLIAYLETVRAMLCPGDSSSGARCQNRSGE